MYRAVVTFETYFLAADDEEAQDDMIHRLDDEWRQNAFLSTPSVRRVKYLASVPPEWKDAIPWGSEDDATVAQWLRAQP